MGLQDTPVADRICIGFFGKRNSGKSSLVNAVLEQSISVVSDVAGTTTDPVSKTMELLPIGPVLLVDTAGIDDEGEIGRLRVEKTFRIFDKANIAVIVTDAAEEVLTEERELAEQLEKRGIPFLIAVNKAEELTDIQRKTWEAFCPERRHVYVSAKKGIGIGELKNALGSMGMTTKMERPLVSDLVKKGDLVILVTPVDASAPKGRLILPQQQTIRELLTTGAVTMVVQPDELAGALENSVKPPVLVIADSQVFEQVSRIVPEGIRLTSFSILFARYKGILWEAVEGARVLDELRDGDTVLISEGCTHHRQCGDIGTEKLPAWILKYTGKRLQFQWTAGTQFPSGLSGIRLVIHCGGCMLSEKEMVCRSETARKENVAMTNYGTAIAHMNGILERSIKHI